MPDIDFNAMIWGISMSATMKAEVHLGQDYQENLLTTRNTNFEKFKQLFDISQKLILNQSEEVFGISTMDWNTIPWTRTTLLHDRAVQLSNANVHVYSDSVLCLGIIHEQRQSIQAWKKKIEWFAKSLECRELDALTENQSSSSGQNFLGFTTLQLLRETQRTMVPLSISKQEQAAAATHSSRITECHKSLANVNCWELRETATERLRRC